MPTAPSERTARIRVVVVDADDLVRETVAALLGIGDRIEVVGIAGQVAAAIDLVRTAEPDVLIVDPRLPDVDEGLAFIKQVHAVAPDVRVVIACPQELLAQEQLAAGTDRCVRKTFRPDDLTAAIVAASESMPA
jgi:DNA-binding NarL/FixJ family response regulator